MTLNYGSGALHEGVGSSAHDWDQVGSQLLEDELADSADILMVSSALDCKEENSLVRNAFDEFVETGNLFNGSLDGLHHVVSELEHLPDAFQNSSASLSKRCWSATHVACNSSGLMSAGFL